MGRKFWKESVCVHVCMPERRREGGEEEKKEAGSGERTFVQVLTAN